jgi:hypothetical protein
MKFEIAWTEDDKPMVRRADGSPMNDDDREEVRELLRRMIVGEVCTNCGAEWSDTTDIEDRAIKVCWACAKSA